MYSPRIDEALIPPLYRLAKSRGIPMTRLVSGILQEALASVDGEQPQAENGAGTAKGGERDARCSE
jgi:post-segregation antitoxin (ccd killing protein)